MGTAVQFIGRKSVVEAYEYRQIAVWGLFAGKSFICGGEDSGELNNLLAKIEGSESAAVYTLKVYKNIDDPDEIDDKTPCNGSFNFKLSKIYETEKTGYTALMSRLDAIEEKINGSGEDDEDDEPAGISGILSGLMKDPQQLVALVGAVKALFLPGSKQVSQPVPAAVGAVVNNQMSDPSVYERLDDALQRLGTADPNIVDHLCKLADLAEKKPETFNFLIKQLDGL